MADNGIETQIHYPKPIHRQQAYREFVKLDLPIAEKIADEILSLPLFPGMEKDEIDRVVDTMNRYAE